MNAVGKFVRLAPSRRRLVVKASLVVAAYRVALTTVPFRWVRGVAARLAEPAREDAAGARPREELTWAVKAASRRVPRATCLTQALALQTLLAQEGYASNLHIGVAKADGRFEAHAWLESGGRVVIGGGDVERFTQLASLGYSTR